MNIIDAILILVVFFSVWSGFQRGFIIGLFDLAGWLGSLLLSFYAYPYLLNWMDGNTDSQSIWSVPIAFFVSFIIIRIVAGAVINWILAAIPFNAHINPVNKVLGLIPGLVNGLIYAALIATFLLIVPITDGISENARNSRLASKFSEPVAIAEDKLSPVFNEAIKKSLAGLIIDPESEKFVKLPYKVESPKERPDLEVKMLDLVNQERTSRGLQPLKADPEMQKVAREHAKDMFERSYFSHYTPEQKDPFDRMKAHHIRFLTAGENLALARNLTMAHEGLMNSPGHRENILRPAFGRVGIGILDGGIYGIMVAQEFRN